MNRILIKSEYKRQVFAVPLTNDEYEAIKQLNSQNKPFKVYDEILPNIQLFGNPLNVDERALSTYIDDKLIYNRWINKSNFFTSNPLTKGEKRYSVQVDIKPSIFLKEIARFFNCKTLLIYLEEKTIKQIEYEYLITMRLVREGYTNQY